MVPTEWRATAVGVAGVAVLAACGGDDAASAGAAPSNPATSIAPPGRTPAADAAGWTMPTGVFRAEKPDGEVLELRVEPGSFRMYDVTDGTPDLGYVADCVAQDPSTVTCTERDGYTVVFVWGGTADALELNLPDAPGNHRAVWEGAPWVRVP
jgi:hypothetical protein